MTSQPQAGRPSSQRSWPVPAALVALSAIPLMAGTLRLVQLAGGPQLMPADERFAGFPLPVVLHIVGATTYAIGSAAGTQAFTGATGGALFGTGEFRDDLAKGAGWVINLAVAEWVIRRSARSKAQRRVRNTDGQGSIATPAGVPS
jgi:hypothetical protein